MRGIRRDQRLGLAAGKLVPLDQLMQARAPIRVNSSQVLFKNGCFDLLHIGPVRFLKDAKDLDDVLVQGSIPTPRLWESRGVVDPSTEGKCALCTQLRRHHRAVS